ncbi:phage antirepressor KilAC domain-containing protein [Capnocytophaga sp. oral taxon 338]|uniref:phage antirepressor KilAC domain-containing protein n=1 Tax=Capnocytophaga sp. oral taxon 338 TaxID=710239 RepID=UPI000202D1AE|nr:phage antirepressor KilAC domain-containing protein [Capnocytophaga sp. oral taxon 338]EGD33313.1 phage antirepressor protein [Capnocytophaga sp. oral taxon 338 str. F0234]
MNNQVYNYNGNNITFQLGNGDVMINATEMAKAFGKTPKDYLRTQSAQELINALSVRLKCLTADLVKVVQGGDIQGTWLHEDVALDFAQWLSVDFKLWCNDRIKELLKTGVTTISDEDEAIYNAMNILQKRLEASKQKVQMLESKVELQETEIKYLAPKAQYTDEVLQSTSTFTTTQIAKDLGMSAQALNQKLKERKIQFFQSGQWFLTHTYQDKGYTDMRITPYFDTKTGEPKTSQSMVWTEKGRQFIHSLKIS